MISLLLAMDRKQGIGYQNDLPWYIPEDLKYFKKVTMGHTIVMGRKTFESIGRALPGRKNVVITRDESFEAPEGVKVIHSLDRLIDLHHASPNEELFVIGGAEIFRQVLPATHRLYITFIDAEYKSDTFFPTINWEEWKMIDCFEGEQTKEVGVHYEFRVYEKKVG